MIAKIFNDGFGFSTTSFDVWAAIGNPQFLRFNPATSSLTYSGSVEIFKYDINTDIHDKRTILYRHTGPDEVFLLAAQSASLEPSASLHTELIGSIPLTANLDISLDVGAYFNASEDGYGLAVDMFDTFLAVGCPYFGATYNIGTSSYFITGSGQVDMYDLSRLDIDPFATRIQPIITAFGTSSGFITASISVPFGQQFSLVVLQSMEVSIPNSPWVSINAANTTNNGGTVTLTTNTGSIANLTLRTIGVVGTDPFLVTIPSPSSISSSFGYSVSLNDNWLAVGSPYESGSRGEVFVYQKVQGAEPSWSFYQSLVVPSEINTGDNFGKSISLNKALDFYSGSIVVGTAKPSGSKAYIYEFDGTLWNQKFTLNSDYNTVYPLTFYPTLPIESGSFPNFYDSFGYSVSEYKDTIVVGAPTDRHIFEFSGSLSYNQGSVYFFERCSDRNKGYYLARKSYGNEKTIHENRLGHSVGVWGDYAVAGCPKTNMFSMSICYLRGTLFQQHYCNDTLENTLDGQFILYHHGTGSLSDTTHLDWNIVNVYQVKKRLWNPYRQFGEDAQISENFITIGAPMFISGVQRVMDMNPTSGSFTGTLNDLGDISGKAYIYNLKNLRESFYVGNVFYRNGKLVVMSSGSAFDGLLKSPIDPNESEYDINFKSKQVIFEKQIVCPVDIGEFNVSTNPSAMVQPSSSYDINKNGIFDFQDADVILRFMMFKSTEPTGHPIIEWSSSILNINTDEEASVYNMYSASFTGTNDLFTKNYSMINNSLYTELDFNNDNKIDANDMNILWKYFIARLTQKNYETYLVPNSQRKFLSDIIDFLNNRTMRGRAPSINPHFFDNNRLSKSDPTGSYLGPYVTTIGLFNGCDLVAVAKLGSPIKITPEFPYNFIVKMDF
jgi:hypothetical protein